MSASPCFQWWFFFPHVWGQEKEDIADVYLLPNVPSWQGDSLVFTLFGADAFDLNDEYESSLFAKLGRADTFVDADRLDVILRIPAFTQQEAVGFVEQALIELGLPCTEMIPGELSRFAETNPHARALATAEATAAEIRSKRHMSMD